MLPRLLSIVVLLGFILPPQSPEIPSTHPNTEYKLYLPLSIYTFPSVEVFTLGYPHGMNMPRMPKCVYGYTTALTPSAVYSVTLAIDMILLSDNTYAGTVYRTPMLDATLLDQKTPFYHCTDPTDYYQKPDGVKLVSASLNPPSGRVTYPLTVTSWEKEVTESGTSIFGTVRNDSGHRLVDIRVVGVLSAGIEKIEPSCVWNYEAVLESTILNPGRWTDFSISYCGEYVSEITAQGVAEP